MKHNDLLQFSSELFNMPPTRVIRTLKIACRIAQYGKTSKN